MTLSAKTLEACSGLASSLADKGYHLMPRLGTPLATMCEFTTTGGIGDNVIQELYERSKIVGEDGKNLHDVARDELVSELKQRARSLLQLSRHVVVPDLNAAYEAVRAIVDSKQEEVGTFDIEQVEREPLLADPIILDQIDRYSNTEVASMEVGEIANLTGDEALELSSSSSEVDALIKQHLENGTIDINNVVRVFAGLNTLDMINVPELVMVHLIANALYNNPDAVSGNVPVTLGQFNNKLATISSQSGRLLMAAGKKEKYQFESGNLYVGAQPIINRKGTTKIRVYGPGYRAALESGLTPEAVIGNELADRQFRRTAEVLANNASMVKRYESHQTRVALESAEVMADLELSALKQVMYSIINELDSKGLSDTGVDILADRLEKAVAREEKSGKALIESVRDVYTDTLYPDTGVGDFLRLIDKVCSERPDLIEKPREAAALALIEYVTQRTATQFIVMDEEAYQAAMDANA